MEGHNCRQLLQFFALFAAFINVAYSSLASEISENEVSVRFDDIYKLEDWTNTNKTEVFRATTQTAVDNYCMANAAMCQLDTYNSLEVIIEEEKVEYFNGDIKITFHVRLPGSGVSNSSELEYVLAKDTVTDIMMLNSTITAIENAVGNTLSYIGDDRINSVDHSLDVIMIPVVCVLFLLVVLLALILVCRESQKEKKNQAAGGVIGDKKGEEGITLTAVKSASDDSGENNASAKDDNTDTADAKQTKKYRRIKKLKEGSDRAPVQVKPELENSSNSTNPPMGIQVQPAHNGNFSTNNSNDLGTVGVLDAPMRRGSSRHGIELPPLTGSIDSDEKDGGKKRKKKHHRSLSKKGLVDAAAEGDDGEGLEEEP